MTDGFGFQKAIEDLETFTSSEEYRKEALDLVSELKKASDAAVEELMETLNGKAANLMEDGNIDGAINVYSTDIGPLAPESKAEREQKILELEKKRQDAESKTGEPGEPAESEEEGA